MPARPNQPTPEPDAQAPPDLKTYTVLFAQDVPHYGYVDIDAQNGRHALEQAKVHWQKVLDDQAPWPLTEPVYSSAILSRIVWITDDANREVATDIPIDDHFLRYAPEPLDKSILENANRMFIHLQLIAAHTSDQYASPEAENAALLHLVKIAQTTIHAITSQAEAQSTAPPKPSPIPDQ